MFIDDEREDGQRYSRWEREIVSDRRNGHGMCDRQLQSSYPIDRPEVRANRFPMDVLDPEMGPFEPHLAERVPRNRMFKTRAFLPHIPTHGLGPQVST